MLVTHRSIYGPLVLQPEKSGFYSLGIIFVVVYNVGKAFHCFLAPYFSLAKPAVITQQVPKRYVTEMG